MALLCYTFSRVERALPILCHILSMWNALWRYRVIFFACGTHSGVIVLYIFACGTHSGIIVLYCLRMERAMALLPYIVLHVEHALALLCYILHVWNVIWYFVLN